MPWIYLAFLTFTYGFCEETMRYLSFRVGHTMRAHRDANGALLAGVGHGGTESLIFALQGVALVLVALLAPQFLRQGAHPSDILAAPWWTFLLTSFDRVIAITAHLGFATLIVLAYRRSWLFYPLTVVVHFLVDFTTFGLQSLPGGNGWSELLFLVYALAALAFIFYIRRRNLAAPQVSAMTGEDIVSAVVE